MGPADGTGSTRPGARSCGRSSSGAARARRPNAAGPRQAPGAAGALGLRPGERRRSRAGGLVPGSFWKRLLPGWWSYGRSRGALHQASPGDAVLLGDMGELAAYRRREDYAREVRQQYAPGLALDGSGEPDWQRTLDGIAEGRAARTAAQAGPRAEGGSGRAGAGPAGSALAVAVAELVDAYRAFREAFEEVGRLVGTQGDPGIGPMRGSVRRSRSPSGRAWSPEGRRPGRCVRP